jgi:integrase/recombinase XerD
MTEAKPAMSALRRRMIDDMSLRNLSPAAQRSYLHAVTKFRFRCPWLRPWRAGQD